jgi:hypothetical protein
MSDPAYRPEPLSFRRLPLPEQIEQLRTFKLRIAARRTVRHYSSEPVPDSLIDDAIAVTGSERKAVAADSCRLSVRRAVVPSITKKSLDVIRLTV